MHVSDYVRSAIAFGELSRFILDETQEVARWNLEESPIVTVPSHGPHDKDAMLGQNSAHVSEESTVLLDSKVIQRLVSQNCVERTVRAVIEPVGDGSPDSAILMGQRHGGLIKQRDLADAIKRNTSLH
jgi:hypothetical protein